MTDSVFVDSFDTQATRALIQWARDDFDSHDQWAWAMSWLFDICGELGRRGDYDQIPQSLDYWPGAGGYDVSEDRTDGIAEIGTDALVYGARVLGRYVDWLKRAGMDY